MIVTLLTDFGNADYFVGAMKGVILSHDERIRIVDLSHEIPPHDTAAAAFLLFAVYRDFPAGTVHVVVVDPGVGSARQPIAVETAEQFFVGPDNGVFSYVMDREAAAETRRIAKQGRVLTGASSTFHGRDVFAPAGAALAAGVPFARVGPLVEKPVRLARLANVRDEGGIVRGTIINVDRFGNCVTTFGRDDLEGGAERYRLRVGGTVVDSVREFYASGTAGEPFAIWGSAGYLEIAVDRDSAAARLGIRRGDEVSAEPR